MTRFRISSLFALAGAIAAGALLFWTSQSVQQAEARLGQLQKSVRAEEQSIRVLHAEWDYLNRPDRLEALAAQHLGLSSASASAFSLSGDASALPAVMIPAMPARKPMPGTMPAVLEAPGQEEGQ